MKRRKAEYIFWAVILITGIVLYWGIRINAPTGTKVSISVNGKVEKVCPLEKDTTIEINKGTNKLIIKDKEVWMESAECPDHICVRQGKISQVGQSIVCLPNKVVVEIQNEEVTGEVDGVAK